MLVSIVFTRHDGTTECVTHEEIKDYMVQVQPDQRPGLDPLPEYASMIRREFFPNMKVNAIKECRAATGLSLKDAKQVIDNYWEAWKEGI